MTEPLPDDRLAEIRATVAHLLEKAAQPNRFPRDNESHWESEGWKNGTANALIKLNPTALLDEIARLRAEVAELKAAAVPPTAPSDDHAAVWLDNHDQLWSDYPTSPPSDAVLPMVWASEQTRSRADLEDQGVTFRRIGWTR